MGGFWLLHEFAWESYHDQLEVRQGVTVFRCGLFDAAR